MTAMGPSVCDSQGSLLSMLDYGELEYSKTVLTSRSRAISGLHPAGSARQNADRRPAVLPVNHWLVPSIMYLEHSSEFFITRRSTGCTAMWIIGQLSLPVHLLQNFEKDDLHSASNPLIDERYMTAASIHSMQTNAQIATCLIMALRATVPFDQAPSFSSQDQKAAS